MKPSVTGLVKRRHLAWLAPLLFLLIFFFIPIAKILALGLEQTSLNLIWEAYGKRILTVLGFTFYQAILSTGLTLLGGLPLAFLFARIDFPAKTFFRTLIAIPFLLPTVVVAAGFNALLGPQGWINQQMMALFGLSSPPIHFLSTLAAILTAHVFYNLIIVLRIVSLAIQQTDARLSEAAQILGANPWQRFWRVSLPVLSPSIGAAALLVFLFNFSSFGVILLLGGPQFSTMEVEIYVQTLQYLNLPLASILSLIHITCTLGLSILYSRYILQINTSNTQTPIQPAQPPKKGLHKIGLAVILSILLCFFSLPLISLPIRAFIQTENNHMVLSLQYFWALFENPRGSLFYVPPLLAAFNSIGYAFITVILSLLLGFPAASLLVKRGKLEKWLDPLLILPLGASAVTLGLGYLLTFNNPIWPAGPVLLTSPWLIPLAHTTIALPFVIRNLQAALAAIPNRYREAASVLGASPWQVWVTVDWPIIAKALMSAGAFAFTISLGEFGAASLLARPEHPTLPTAIYRLLSQPGNLNYGQAMVMATLLMLLAGLGIWLIERFRVAGEL